MLGSRKSAIEVAQTITRDRVEDIKKVDIDIFKSGEEKVFGQKFLIKELSLGTPIKNMYIDADTGYMRFSIKANGVDKIVSKLTLDAETSLNPQVVSTEDGNRYEVGFKLKQPNGTHFMTLKIANCAKDPATGEVKLAGNGQPVPERFETYSYRFQILVREQDKMSTMDVPQDSYRDALLNVTKLWLLSRKYDRVRHPDWAGFFDNQLRAYEMSEAGASKVEADLLEAISSKVEDVYISEIKATPHPESRSWDVSVVSTDTETQISTLAAEAKERQVTISIEDERMSDIEIIE